MAKRKGDATDDLRIDIQTAIKAMEGARESFQRHVNDVVSLTQQNEQLRARVQELLEANNREVDWRRAAEAETSRLRLQLAAAPQRYALWAQGTAESGIVEQSPSAALMMHHGTEILTKEDPLVRVQVLRGTQEIDILVIPQRVWVTDDQGSVIWKREKGQK